MLTIFKKMKNTIKGLKQVRDFLITGNIAVRPSFWNQIRRYSNGINPHLFGRFNPNSHEVDNRLNLLMSGKIIKDIGYREYNNIFQKNRNNMDSMSNFICNIPGIGYNQTIRQNARKELITDIFNNAIELVRDGLDIETALDITIDSMTDYYKEEIVNKKYEVNPLDRIVKLLKIASLEGHIAPASGLYKAIDFQKERFVQEYIKGNISLGNEGDPATQINLIVEALSIFSEQGVNLIRKEIAFKKATRNNNKQENSLISNENKRQLIHFMNQYGRNLNTLFVQCVEPMLGDYYLNPSITEVDPIAKTLNSIDKNKIRPVVAKRELNKAIEDMSIDDLKMLLEILDIKEIKQRFNQFSPQNFNIGDFFII